MAREMFLFQSTWWNLPSWLVTHWKGCAVPWAHCLFPSLSSTFHCEKHHEQHEGYRTPHSGSLGTGLVNFDPVQAYSKVSSWHGAHQLKLQQVSSHSSHSLLLQILPSSLLLLYVQERQKSGTLSSPYLVQSTSPQSPFALAAALDWRTHQMTEQSKVLLSTQQAVVPWCRVQFQMWWGMKAWLHHKATVWQFCCLDTWLWTHLQYPGFSCRRNGTSQTSMPKKFLPCVAPGSKWTLTLILSQSNAFLFVVYLAVILMLRLLFLLASSNSPLRVAVPFATWSTILWCFFPCAWLFKVLVPILERVKLLWHNLHLALILSSSSGSNHSLYSSIAIQSLWNLVVILASLSTGLNHTKIDTGHPKANRIDSGLFWNRRQWQLSIESCHCLTNGTGGKGCQTLSA